VISQVCAAEKSNASRFEPRGADRTARCQAAEAVNEMEGRASVRPFYFQLSAFLRQPGRLLRQSKTRKMIPANIMGARAAPII
jgi:hypothetical protein